MVQVKRKKRWHYFPQDILIAFIQVTRSMSGPVKMLTTWQKSFQVLLTYIRNCSSPQNHLLFHPEESAVLAFNSAEKSKEHHNASKVDTPPNIDSQTFLSHDTETPVAINQPLTAQKTSVIYPRGSGSS